MINRPSIIAFQPDFPLEWCDVNKRFHCCKGAWGNLSRQCSFCYIHYKTFANWRKHVARDHQCTVTLVSQGDKKEKRKACMRKWNEKKKEYKRNWKLKKMQETMVELCDDAGTAQQGQGDAEPQLQLPPTPSGIPARFKIPATVPFAPPAYTRQLPAAILADPPFDGSNLASTQNVAETAVAEATFPQLPAVAAEAL
jgi:hypothetical protein